MVYFPWDIDRTFWEVLAVDHWQTAAQRGGLGGQRTASGDGDGPGVLDVTVWRQKDSMTVHLVNLTNPMMMKGPVREFIPLPAQQVAIRLPDGLKARHVRLLVSGATPRVQEGGGELRLTVPSILDHEVVAVDL